MLSLVLQNSELQDSDTDILKSSSIPTLLTSMLKVVFKKGEEFPLTLAYLIRATSLLIRPTFNSTVGIDPMLIKGLLLLIPGFLKVKSGSAPANTMIQMYTLNTIGIFLSQASIMPAKMINIYKEIIDMKLLENACLMIGQISSSANQLQKLAIEVVSTAVHPFYGEVYSFPWLRGPHNAVLEYNENISSFEVLRETVYNCLNEFDWTNKLTTAYKEFFDSDSIACICIFRIVLQMLRFKLDTVSVLLQDGEIMKLFHLSLSGTHVVCKALSLEIFRIIISQIDSQMIDFSDLELEATTI